MKRIAINGFGRIGRAALKIIMDAPNMEVVAVNDLLSIDNASYLLKYDSAYGPYEKTVTVRGDKLMIDNHSINYSSIKNPADLPWKSLGVEVVIESTGLFTNRQDAEKHIQAGAQTVVLSGPTNSAGTPTVVHGVNTNAGSTSIFSCASCTTNNISPPIEILDRRIGIKKAVLNTIHAYTASQTLVDAASKKDPRMGRAAALNLAPASTGAAVATAKALPEMQGKFDGIAIRTPVPVGSISDITFISARFTSAKEVNEILIEEAQTDRYKNVIKIEQDPVVSSDIIKSPYASIIDIALTRVIDGDLVKIMSWYDNEWGFTNQMIRQIKEL